MKISQTTDLKFLDEDYGNMGDNLNVDVSHAINTIKLGNREEGRQLLEQLLETEARNEQVWFWLSTVVDTDEDRENVLRNVLALDPDNVAAQKALKAFQTGDFDPEIIIGLAPREEDAIVEKTSFREQFFTEVEKEDGLERELASLRAQSRIFLCHASEDKPRAQKLYHQLRAAGYHPWLDKYDLLAGQDWWQEIEKIIRDPYNLVVICLSTHSSTKRGVIQREIKRALDVLDEMPEGGIYLIPARLEPCQPPDRLAHLHWVDLYDPGGFEYLTRSLDHELSQRR